MTFITQLFIKLFSFFLETIGNIATINTCGGYFDEPEVPQELTDLKNNNFYLIRKCVSYGFFIKRTLSFVSKFSLF